MFKFFISVTIILFLAGCNVEPQFNGFYQSELVDGYHVQFTVQPDEQRFMEYIDNRLVDEGSFEKIGDNTFLLKGIIQQMEITLSNDNSFDIIVSKLNDGNPIKMARIGNIPTSFEMKFDDVEEYKQLLLVDKGHEHLDLVLNEIQDYANTLEKAEYIGFIYSTDQLYKYLLAIYHKDSLLLDPEYEYEFTFSTFEELVNKYHDHVDFNTIVLTNLSHKDHVIEIELNYYNNQLKQEESLHYQLNYDTHGLEDLSVFD